MSNSKYLDNITRYDFIQNQTKGDEELTALTGYELRLLAYEISADTVAAVVNHDTNTKSENDEKKEN